MSIALKAAPGTVAISDDELRRFAPSVFASQPIEGVSERYSFLPTSSILNGMRENGWVPVRAQEQSIRTEARRGFQKHVVRFARLQHLQSWEKNQVRPEVVLVNRQEAPTGLHQGADIDHRLPIIRSGRLHRMQGRRARKLHHPRASNRRG
jgi:hypothetical protein